MTDRPNGARNPRTKTRLSAAPMLKRALRDGAIFAAVVTVVGAVVGMLVAGLPGLWGGVLGGILSAVFLGITAVSILIGGRLAKGDLTSPVFFGTVIGTYFVKLVIFVVLTLLLRSQSWIDGRVYFVVVIIVVLGSLVLDLVAFARTRVPYASDVTLPGEEERGLDERDPEDRS
ncbi:hypothetical protein [Humibacter ginsenosidimutans]|uniref:ATP synthase protein I n=1 Tax=Humibacter ginsenosidimutans TaxID=2599293 RepID=A0A5B8MA65_9MICO|nr:hypothetical protein [Humibacter ginsenosidimutans]QDZ16545.1 hypothetical protein FPZ11_18945 [Humibacter ginsenosidimutans]